ncbi:hypothetical protein BCR32DRAFT_328146 [Anaeromyces robustus]|uniref:Uncharacterized protein n=1 Tax=Anaeromyces robustus TaxID=1754192 RepID=A0A1Y1X1W8_9FUNG|nr:hypothetical protein BCR32DRAFT_328146 [Anaeromyces robustus]|eukprot:ORX79406.1 hypothetical protein BCR32DRAFT_328146 [Anaeromyces robustus]
MVRQTGNTLINNKSWAQIVTNTGVQNKLQNSQSKKVQNKSQKTKQTQTQTQRTYTQQLKQVKQYLDKASISVKQSKKFISTTQYPRSISSAQLQALQQEFQGLCNLFNANNYTGKSSQKKAWIQTNGKCIISVATCYSLKHKPVPNVMRIQQQRVTAGKGLKFIPKQTKNKKNNKGQPKFGESRLSTWGTEKAWGKNQPKQIREPPKEQVIKQKQMKQQQEQQQQMEKIQQRHKKQMELLQRAQLKQQELLLKKQTEQRKKLLQYQKQQKQRLQYQTNQISQVVSKPTQASNIVYRNVYQRYGKQQAIKPVRERLNAVRKQNQMVVDDGFKYTLNQLVDAFNYFPKKSYSGDRAWKYNKFLGGFFSTASYFAQKNAPYVPSSRPRVKVTNGLPVYTFNVKPISNSVITPYNSNLQGVRTEGNGRYFEHWHIGSIWTHYYSKPRARKN